MNEQLQEYFSCADWLLIPAYVRKDVADILGHSRIETTENYYISSSDESRKHASEIFEKSIQSSIVDEIIGKY